MAAPPQGDEWRFSSDRSNQNAKVRVGRLAGRQSGRVAWRQLRRLGVAKATIAAWVRDGYLHRVLPGVYAVGHAAGTIEADLMAALLYAGPGAMLSHATAVWWRGWLKFPPPRIEVSTPRRVASRSRVVVHGRRLIDHQRHRALPITTPAQTLLDYASAATRERLRFVLANADYDDALDLAAIERLTGRGIAGSAAIHTALEVHRPQLAETRSELERRLLELSERFGLPAPDRTNVMLAGQLVDAVWYDRRVVVEVDGYRGHRTPAQLRRDHRRDLELRRLGFVVLRYTWDQVTGTPELVAADIRGALARAVA